MPIYNKHNPSVCDGDPGEWDAHSPHSPGTRPTTLAEFKTKRKPLTLYQQRGRQMGGKVSRQYRPYYIKNGGYFNAET